MSLEEWTKWATEWLGNTALPFKGFPRGETREFETPYVGGRRIVGRRYPSWVDRRDKLYTQKYTDYVYCVGYEDEPKRPELKAPEVTMQQLFQEIQALKQEVKFLREKLS